MFTAHKTEISIAHSDGQKIAKELSTGISKETKRTKQLLEDYNGVCYEFDHQHSPIPLVEVLLPSSDFWANLSAPNADSKQVPWKIQREIIQAFLRMQRSEEEKLLKADMHTTVTYWSKRAACISKAIVELGCSMADDQFSRGAICSLKQLKWEAELHQSRAIATFGDLIELPTTVLQTYRSQLSSDSSDDESSDSDTESDSDYDYGDDDLVH